MEKVWDKSKLKEMEGDFIALPQNIKHYVYMEGYKPEMSYLYALIVDRYNVEKGYAFPSHYTLAKDYGTCEKTVGEHLKVLESVGLIDIFDNGRGKVKYYKPLTPLSKEELFAKYPKAGERYEKIAKKTEQRAESDKLRLWAKGE